MFRIVNRLIQWTGKYKRRIYIGLSTLSFTAIFTAIPIMLAANGLSAVLDDWGGVKPLEGRDIWIMLGAMILAVLGRYLFSYLRAITQESVGYEATADERIRLGDILKRVSLGFSVRQYGRTVRSGHNRPLVMEMFAMNMVNTVVNGYIYRYRPDMFLAFYSPLAGGIALAGVRFFCSVPSSAGGAQSPKRAHPSKGTGRYGGKLHRVSAGGCSGESL